MAAVIDRWWQRLSPGWREAIKLTIAAVGFALMLLVAWAVTLDPYTP